MSLRSSLQIGCLAGLLAAYGAAPAIGGQDLKVLGSDFTSRMLQADGTEIDQSTTRIPLIPDVSCYQWTIEVDAKGPLRIKEVFKLPAAPETWGEADNDEFSPTEPSKDRTAAVTILFMPAKDGVLANAWCVTAGDPPGPYTIEVFHEEQSLKKFEFTLVE